jgi:large subunit ribosomal protein L1
MVDEKIVEAIKKAKEGKKRNFTQGIDLIINLKNIDLTKAENKIKAEAALPNPTGKVYKIGIFADSLVSKVKELGDQVILIKKTELEGMKKKDGKILAKKCKAFFAEAPLMPLVGKNMGPILAPKGLMPKPVPPTIPSLKPLVERELKVLKIALKKDPTVHCGIGKEDMDENKVAENAEAIIKALKSALPRAREQVKEIIIKTTMGVPVKVESERDGRKS